MSDRASHRARSARASLANARSSLVGRPNARLRRTRRRGFVATRASARSSCASITCCAANHVKRRCPAEASIRPTSVHRGCTCATRAIALRRALHGSSTSSKSIISSGTLRPRRSSAVPTAAALLHARARRRPRGHRRWEKPHCSRRGAAVRCRKSEAVIAWRRAAECGQEKHKNGRRSPRRAALSNLTPLDRRGVGVSRPAWRRKKTTFRRPPRARWPHVAPSSPQSGE